MKITKVEALHVTVPMTSPFRKAAGAEPRCFHPSG